MEYTRLGNTQLQISKLCFGGLTVGPLQANLSVEEGAKVILKAFEMGVNFIDTAELYRTYPHIKEAIKRYGRKPVIATKSYAYRREDAQASLEKARKALDVDVIDIFLMHEQESQLTLRGHREALEYYLEAKQRGMIHAVGVSTHNIKVVEAVCDMPEIEVIHPIVNQTGLGIGDGSIQEMLLAIKKAYDCHKGIYSMKPLGGGNLLSALNQSMQFVLNIPYLHSIAVGMQSVEEVITNVHLFEGQAVPEEITALLKKRKRKLHIEDWCEGCGRCIKRCGQKALTADNGKVVVQQDACVLCGYCASVCTQFAIKIF